LELERLQVGPNLSAETQALRSNGLGRIGYEQAHGNRGDYSTARNGVERKGERLGQDCDRTGSATPTSDDLHLGGGALVSRCGGKIGTAGLPDAAGVRGADGKRPAFVRGWSIVHGVGRKLYHG